MEISDVFQKRNSPLTLQPGDSSRRGLPLRSLTHHSLLGSHVDGSHPVPFPCFPSFCGTCLFCPRLCGRAHGGWAVPAQAPE